ncbi:hypothetical protein D9M68_494840 [compost metagenome]
MVLDHDRQPAPVAIARFGGEALDHFLLQHEVHVADQVGVIEQVEDQRRGDVVGQVADHPQAVRLGAQLGEVELHRIALVQGELRIEAELELEQRNQVLVQLDHVEMRAATGQALGEGALAGADFHQAFACTRVNGAQDAVDDAGVVQEVLAEAFAGAVLVKVGHGRLRGSSLKLEAEEGAQFSR